MNWKIIFLLSAVGFIMGFASVYGFLKSNELFYWMIAGLIISGILGFNLKEKIFFTGFLVGFINSVIAGLIQFIFFDNYLVNNPEIKAELSKLPEGYDPGVFFLAASPIIGIASGFIVGILTFASYKIINWRK